MRRAAGDVGKPLVGAIVEHLESAQAAPEIQARLERGDQKLRDQAGARERSASATTSVTFWPSAALSDAVETRIGNVDIMRIALRFDRPSGCVAA